MTRALVVDDEGRMRRVLQILLEHLGVEATPAETAEAALERFQHQKFDLVLTDLKLPGMSGVDLLARIRTLNADVPVIVVTAYGTVQSAVAAMKQGAFDYILKPFDVPAIEMVIRNALEMRRYCTENPFLKHPAVSIPVFENLIGHSPAMQAVYGMIRQVGTAKTAVLITGETGTGKELAARAIHNLSPRRDQLFVPLNCAAIPAHLLESELFGHAHGACTGAQTDRAGKFEVADGGTLFLDEIGDMPLPLQAKLLRALQEGVIERIGSNRPVKVDVRVVSATSRDLATGMAAGTLRADLYHRLHVFHVHLPPLRERREDIRPLATSFLHALAEQLGKPPLALGPEACALLEQHDWPGNVRELRNVVERVAAVCSGASVDADLVRRLLPGPRAAAPPETPRDTLRLADAVKDVERRVILRALSVANDNKAEAARLLGICERTLWYKLKRYSL